MKKIYKKFTVFVLSVCLALSGLLVFSACGKAYSAEINWNVDLTNPITVNMLYPYSGLKSFGNDHTSALIEEATGYKGKYTQVDPANEDNEINNALSSQEKYHMMKLSQAQYDPYVENGTWLDLTELLKTTTLPNGQAFGGKTLYDIIDLMPGAWDSVTYTNSKGETGIYAIPEVGYTAMEDYGFIWNTQHLKEIGWYEGKDPDAVPHTLTEVTDTLLKLQEHYGTDKNYHALGIAGSNYAELEPFMAAFGSGNRFYVDENGKIQFYIYDDGMTGYVKYMNMLKKEGVLSDSWQTSSEADISAKFAKESNSCVFLTYWWVTPLCNTILSNELAKKYGMENTYRNVHDNLIAWNTRVRGDGSYGSEVQERAKHISGISGSAYYITIPYYMAEDAVYVIDYLSKKLQNYAYFYGGKEGVDWKVVEEPADGKENYSEKIIYMQPWEYELNGETKTGGGKWIQLTDSYIANIVDNSMYACGANVKEAISLFHLRETGFDAWPIAIPFDDTIISDACMLHPTFYWWSPISILSRTMAKRGVATAIDARGDAGEALDITRAALKKNFAKKNGVSYYYWSDDIVKQMTDWYNSKTQ